jgi:hypothetical protein
MERSISANDRPAAQEAASNAAQATTSMTARADACI